jgi:hypothetical protein
VNRPLMHRQVADKVRAAIDAAYKGQLFVVEADVVNGPCALANEAALALRAASNLPNGLLRQGSLLHAAQLADRAILAAQR